MNISELRAKIRELGLKTRPPLPPETLQEWEEQLGIRFPAAYAAFITQIGDGWEKQVVRRTLWPEMKALSACEDMALLARPFPYTAPYIWENRGTNPLPGESDEAWDRRVEELMRPKRFGNLPLTRGACGERLHLIVTGACAGEIWQFTDVGIAPCSPPAAFSDWITTWLEKRG